MNSDDFESQMRSLEYYHSLKVMPGVWPIIRVDGKNFSKFTQARFEKPYDEKFRDLMIQTAQEMLIELQGLYAYTESDEISILLPDTWDLFDREIEKMVSLSASIASSTFSLACGEAVLFDSRVCLGVNPHIVSDYFAWRQTDAARCSLSNWCYWTLRKNGKNARQATKLLHSQKFEQKFQLLLQNNINFKEVPKWQRYGVGIYWEEYEKEGFNPKTKEKVLAARRRIKVQQQLPIKEAYRQFIADILNGRS